MADMKTFCINTDCMNIPGLPVVQVTSISQLNGIDYPCIIYGSIDIPDTGLTSMDWNGLVIPTTGQVSQIIDYGHNNVVNRVDDGSSTWSIANMVAKGGDYTVVDSKGQVDVDISSVSGTETNVSTSNDTEKVVNLATISKKGILVGYLYANFNAKSGGWRSLWMRRDSTNLLGIKVDQPTNSTTNLTMPICNPVESGQVIKAVLRQTSGGALTVANVTINARLFAE